MYRSMGVSSNPRQAAWSAAGKPRLEAADEGGSKVKENAGFIRPRMCVHAFIVQICRSKSRHLHCESTALAYFSVLGPTILT